MSVEINPANHSKQSMFSAQPVLSVILPAYNEEAMIVETLDGLRSYLVSRPETFEILVVDDGSIDRTVALASGWAAAQKISMRVLINERNMGKGFSIRRGALESRGQYIVFTDADLPYDLTAMQEFLNAFQNGYELAIGSRVLPGSTVRGVPRLRFAAGQIFSWMVQGILFHGLPDTQCGFKGFTHVAAREIFQRVSISGFGFDVELLFIARKLGYRIKPIPVQMIHFRRDSRVSIIRDSLEMFANLFTVRWNDLLGKYK